MLNSRTVTTLGTLATILTATLVLACNKDEPKKDQPVTTPGAPEQVTPPEGATPVKDGPPPVAVGEVMVGGGVRLRGLSAEPEILGHFAISSPSKLLAHVKDQLVPAQYAGFLEEAALRSFMSLALDKRSNLAMNYNFAAPVGCALIDPRSTDPKVGCTFGYNGGAKAFVTDLGEAQKAPDAAGHVAAYNVDGRPVYIDALGEAVVVSLGADTFTTASAYLQRNIIGRAGDMHGDLEVVGYIATIFDRYQAELKPALDALDTTNVPAPTGNKSVDDAIAAWAGYQKRSNKVAIERVAELAQLSLYVSVEPIGVVIGGAAFPKPGTRMATEIAVHAPSRLDATFAGSAPEGTAFLVAMHASPQAHELASAVESRQLMGEVWGALTGSDPTSITAAITAFQQENSQLYDGQTMVAIGHEPGALFGVTMAGRLQPGKAARDGWKAWTERFTPQAVLGPEFSQYVTWKFKTDASTVDGTPVDRWTIEPGAGIKGTLEKEMPADAKAFVTKAFGGMYLNIDRAEVNNNVVFIVSPKAEANYMKRAIAGFQGQGNVSSEPGLARAITRDPETAGIVAFDLKQLMTWIRGMGSYGVPTEKVPQNLGTDLGDFFVTLHYTGEGAMAMEYVLSQQLIEQIKQLAQGAG